MIWKILGIEQTKEIEVIRNAYRNKLRFVNPEDDEEGFIELRRAYEEALQYAESDEEEDLGEAKQSLLSAEKKTDVDFWIDRVDQLYKDVKTRMDETKWNTLLHDPVCDDLDTELEAEEKLLVYLMSHPNLPRDIWQMIDERFDYAANIGCLKERFPENFLEYMTWQMKTESFIDYTMFEGKTDSHADDYINKLYEIKNAFEEKDLKKISQLLNELSRFEISHPFGKVEEARYLLLKHEPEEALSIMEDLDFEYSDNPYIERNYAEALIANEKAERAKEIYEALLEENPKNYAAMLGHAKCIFLMGDAETAKEEIEDILEDRIEDTESLELLETINGYLVGQYKKMLSEKQDREITFRLGWCYYQQKEFDKGIALLDEMGEGEDYDYVNLRCRLYLANENYDLAYPYAKIWTSLIEKTEDDGSKEAKKRKNRLSLAHFSEGVCLWETRQNSLNTFEKKELLKKVRVYIDQAVSEENNILVRLSYMEQLARFYMDVKEYETCIELCNRIIEEDRGFYPAFVHRQKANYELRNAKEVIDDYFNCIELYDGYAGPYILAAEVFFAFDQYDDVEQVLEAAKEANIESDSLELFRIRCIHYRNYSEDNTKKALKRIEQLRKKVLPAESGTDIENMEELEREYAILFWDSGQTDMAIRIVDAYIAAHPEQISMYHLKVDILNKERQYEKALAVCEQMKRINPTDVDVISQLAGCYERLGKPLTAIQFYEEILKYNPSYIPAIRRLMYLYSYLSNKEADLNKCRTGIEYATRLIALTGSAEGYVERGNLYIDLYELEKAVEDCKKAIELDSEAYYAYNNLGCALLKLRRIDEAIVPLEHVIQMEPDKDHLPYLNLAECYALKKEYDKAIDSYRQVLRIRPNTLYIKKQIAELYMKKGEYDKAIAIYKKQLENATAQLKKMNPLDKINFYKEHQKDDEKEKIVEAYWDLGEAYRRSGDLKSANECYKKIETGLGHVFSYYSRTVSRKLAEYFRDRGNLKDAEQMIRKGLGKTGDEEKGSREYAYLYFTYATILLELGKQKEAAEYAGIYLKMLYKRKGSKEQLLQDARYRQKYLYEIAMMHLCAGNPEKAKEYFQKMQECELYVTCTTWENYEYYFGMGLLEELSGDPKRACEFYEKAIDIKGDYPCAKRHLELLR